MKNFGKRNDHSSKHSFGGGRDYGKKRFDRREHGNRQMYKAVCDNCGKDCEVPFNPTAGKPIYCSDCFEKLGKFSRQDRDKKSFRRRDFGDRQSEPQNTNVYSSQIEDLNKKLDKIISLLEGNNVPAEKEKTQLKPENKTETKETKPEKSEKTSSKKN